MVRFRTPIVKAALTGGVEIAEDMLDGIVVGWGQASTRLCAFDDVIGDIRAACYHGVDGFANDVAVAAMHLLLELVLVLGIRVPDCVLQLLEERRSSWVGQRTINQKNCIFHPSISVLGTYTVQICSSTNFDVVLGLLNIHTIVHVDATLLLEWDGEEVVQHVESDVGDVVGGASDGEIVNLLFEEDSFPFNESRI